MPLDRRLRAALAVTVAIGLAACSPADGRTDGGDGQVRDEPTTSAVSTPEVVPGTDSDGDGQMSSAEDTIEMPSDDPLTTVAVSVAAALRADVEAAVERHGWTDPARVLADGYHEMPAGGTTHLYSDAAVSDGIQFDADRPEVIVVDDGELLGVMFLAASFSLDQPPPPGSPMNTWHYHVIDPPVCFSGLAFVSEALEDGSCPPGQVLRRASPLMTHVWLGDGGDPFDSDMSGAGHHGG